MTFHIRRSAYIVAALLLSLFRLAAQPSDSPARFTAARAAGIIDPGIVSVRVDADGTPLFLSGAGEPVPVRGSFASGSADDIYWQNPVIGDTSVALAYVRAFAVDGNYIYVGGRFNRIGGISANNIAMYNKLTGVWQALGDGENNGVEHWVAAILVDGADIYVGGCFTRAGDIAANNIARLRMAVDTNPEGGITTARKAIWSAMDAGIEGAVYAIARRAGEICIGGTFILSGSDSLHNIARWDGSKWRGLISPSGDGLGLPGAVVLALGVRGDDLYVGGTLWGYNDFTGYPIVKWNGSRWDTVTARSYRSYLVASIVSAPNGDLYVGGSFQEMGGKDIWNIARYDGSDWHSLGSGIGRRLSGAQSRVGAITLGPGGQIYAAGVRFDTAGSVGVNDIAVWDGSEWRALGDGLYYGAQALATVGDEIWAGGEFTRAGTVKTVGLARWGSGAWSQIDGGIRGSGHGFIFSTVSGPSGEVYIGGTFNLVGDVGASNLARWEGSAFVPVGDGAGGTVGMMTVGSDGTLYLPGYSGYGSISRTGDIHIDGIAAWNGSSWRSMAEGLEGQILNMGVVGEQIVAAGYFSGMNLSRQTMLARWDGSRWLPCDTLFDWEEGNMNMTPTFNAFAVDGSDLYIGGLFRRVEGKPARNIARWDGKEWHPVGEGVVGVENALGGRVDALAAEGGRVYAAGWGAGVTRWDGSSWSAISPPEDLTIEISRLVAVRGNLYIGGAFSAIAGVEASNVAKWDGTGWSPLGSGTNHTVTGMAAGRDGLFVCGNFNLAGGKPASRLARWSKALSSVAGSEGERTSLSCAVVGTGSSRDLVITLPRRAEASVQIVDIRGAEILSLPAEDRPAGESRVRIDLSELPVGAYFCRVVAGAGSAVARFTVE